MDNNEDAFADNYAERDQARALREQARAGGLRFEAYLTGDQADWLLERVEQGLFHDPSARSNAIVQNFRELEPHLDLRDALLGRMLDGASADLESARPADEVFDELRRELATPRPKAARWEKIAR